MGSKTNNMGTHKINEVANMERKSPLMLLWNLTTFWSVPITACGALARGKQGYKKVVFPLITPPWGRLWSVLHWKSCWSVVKCQSTWKHCFTPCEGSSWRHWQRALSSSYPDLVLLSPPGVDICSLFFFFPAQYPLFQLKWASWFPWVTTPPQLSPTSVLMSQALWVSVFHPIGCWPIEG